MHRSILWTVLLILLGAGLVWALKEPEVGSGDGIPLEVGAGDEADEADEVGVGGQAARLESSAVVPVPGPVGPSSASTQAPAVEPVREAARARVDAALAAWRKGEWSTAIKLFREDHEALPIGFTKQSMAFVSLRAQLAQGDAEAALEALGHQLALLAEHAAFEPLGTARTIPKTSTLFYRDLKPFEGAGTNPSNAGLPAHHPYDHAGSASVLRRWYDAGQTLALGKLAWNQGAVAVHLRKEVQAAALRIADPGDTAPTTAVSVARFVALQMLLLTGKDKSRYAAFRREAKRFVRDHTGSTNPDIRILTDHLRHLLTAKE